MSIKSVNTEMTSARGEWKGEYMLFWLNLIGRIIVRRSDETYLRDMIFKYKYKQILILNFNLW